MSSSKQQQPDDVLAAAASNSNYGAMNDEPTPATTENGSSSKEDEETTTAHQGHHLKGIFFIMLGAFSFSIMFLLVKLMGPGANTFTLVLYRSLVQIIISLVTLLQQGENPLGPPDCRFWLCVRGLFGSAAVCAWFFGTFCRGCCCCCCWLFTNASAFGIFDLLRTAMIF